MKPLDFALDYCPPKDQHIDGSMGEHHTVTSQYLVLPDKQVLIGDEYKGSTASSLYDHVPGWNREASKHVKNHPDFKDAHMLLCIITVTDTFNGYKCYSMLVPYVISAD